MAGLTATNLLLAIIAVMVVVQAIAAAVAIVAFSRAYRLMVTRIDEVERELRPVLPRVLEMLDRADRITARADRISARVEEGTEKLDTALAVTAHGAEIALATVNGRVKRTVAFATAVARALKAASEGWRAGPARPPLRIVERPEAPVLPARTR